MIGRLQSRWHRSAPETFEQKLRCAVGSRDPNALDMLVTQADAHGRNWSGAVDSSGATPLIVAVRARNETAVRKLVDADSSGASLAAADQAGNTPLMWSVRVGHLQIFRLLLEEAGDPGVENGQLITPLLAACIGASPRGPQSSRPPGYANFLASWLWGSRYARLLEAWHPEKIATYRLMAHALATYDDGLLLQDAAQNSPLKQAIGDDHQDLLRDLLASPNNVDACSNGLIEHETPLTWAISKDKLRAAEALICMGVTPLPSHVLSTSALAVAAGKGLTRLLQLMLDQTNDRGNPLVGSEGMYVAMQSAANAKQWTTWNYLRQLQSLPDAASYTGPTLRGLRHGVEHHSLLVRFHNEDAPAAYTRAWRNDAAAETVGLLTSEAFRASGILDSLAFTAPLTIAWNQGRTETVALKRMSDGAFVPSGEYALNYSQSALGIAPHVLTETGSYVDGIPQPQRKLTFSDGSSEDQSDAQSGTFAWTHGAIRETGRYKGGRKDGDYRRTDTVTGVKESGMYAQGVRMGAYTIRNAENTLVETGHYINGQKLVKYASASS